MKFKLHDESSAPEAARPLLEASRKQAGMIPNLHSVMAEAPAVLEGYKELNRLVLESSFNDDEKTVLWQSVNVEHGCHYCVPAHTAIAKSMKVSDDIISALRDKTPLPNEKLEALRTFILAVVRKRGSVSQEELRAFHSAGYGQRQVLEVILGISQKVMSNYINNIAETPLDEPFMKFEWKQSG